MVDKDDLTCDDENGTLCIKCQKYYCYEELTLDDSTSDSDGPEEYACFNCIK